MIEAIAWLILRIGYAFIFLFPLKDLLKDFKGAVNLVQLIIPFMARFFAIVMIMIMLLGALSILLGVYAQIAGLALLVYCLMGVAVHYRLAQKIAMTELSHTQSKEDQAQFDKVVALGILGNQTSGLKNIVLAAVGCFFMLMGSGPLSLTNNLF